MIFQGPFYTPGCGDLCLKIRDRDKIDLRKPEPRAAITNPDICMCLHKPYNFKTEESGTASGLILSINIISSLRFRQGFRSPKEQPSNYRLV